MFGPRVPSINTGGERGLQFHFPAANKEDTNLTRIEGSPRTIQTLPFWATPINTAIIQWTNLINQGGFSIPRPRKGKKEFTEMHRVAVQVSADPLFTSMYNTMKTMANAARASGAEFKKRKRDVDGEDRKGKKAKVGAEMGDI
jgi:hypothetical protein